MVLVKCVQILLMLLRHSKLFRVDLRISRKNYESSVPRKVGVVAYVDFEYSILKTSKRFEFNARLEK